MLEDYIDVGNFGDDAHKDGYVRVPKNALHNYFVLNLLEEIVSKSWVENFLYGHWCAIELAFVNN